MPKLVGHNQITHMTSINYKQILHTELTQRYFLNTTSSNMFFNKSLRFASNLTHQQNLYNNCYKLPTQSLQTPLLTPIVFENFINCHRSLLKQSIIDLKSVHTSSSLLINPYQLHNHYLTTLFKEGSQTLWYVQKLPLIVFTKISNERICFNISRLLGASINQNNVSIN